MRAGTVSAIYDAPKAAHDCPWKKAYAAELQVLSTLQITGARLCDKKITSTELVQTVGEASLHSVALLPRVN